MKMDGDRVQMLSADEVGGILVLLPVPWQQSGAWILPVMLVAIAILVLTLAGVADRGVAQAASRHSARAVAARARPCIDSSAESRSSTSCSSSGWMGIVAAGNADLAAYDGHLDAWFYVAALARADRRGRRDRRALEWLARDRRQARLEGHDLECRAGGLVRRGHVVRVRLQPDPLHAEVLKLPRQREIGLQTARRPLLARNRNFLVDTNSVDSARCATPFRKMPLRRLRSIS